MANPGTFENVRDVISEPQFRQLSQDFRLQLLQAPRYTVRDTIYHGRDVIEVVMANGRVVTGQAEVVYEDLEKTLQQGVDQKMFTEAQRRRQQY
jgi:hypothetical protein